MAATLADLRARRNADTEERDRHIEETGGIPSPDDVGKPQTTAEIDPDQIPQEMIDQIFADPNMTETLTAAIAMEGLSGEPADLAPVEKRALILRMMKASQRQRAPQASAGDDVEISDAMARQIFADPDAQAMLKQVMADNTLEGAPSDLPVETQRAIVKALVANGVIRFGDSDDAA